MPYNSETSQYERRSTTVIDATPDGDTVAVAIDTKLDLAADDAVGDLNHHMTNGRHYPVAGVTAGSQFLKKSPAGVVSWTNGIPFDDGVAEAELAASTGSAMVGYGSGTVKDALDARPTSATLAASTGSALVGHRSWTVMDALDSRGYNIEDLIESGMDLQQSFDFAAENGLTLVNGRGYEVVIDETVEIPSGLKAEFDNIKISASTSFSGNNAFVSTVGEFYISGMEFDGSNLPTATEAGVDPADFVVGAIFNITSSPTVAFGDKTNANTQKIKNVVIKNCVLKNQPGSYIAACNVGNITIKDSYFETLGDSVSTVQNGISLRWANEAGTDCTNISIINNTFVQLVLNGVGTLKILATNGVASAVVSGNIFERRVTGTPGTAGLSEAIFLKRATGVAVNGNTVREFGTGVKVEQDSVSITVSGNAFFNMRETTFQIQGSKGVVIDANTIVNTASQPFYISTHSPSGSSLSDCIVSNNLIVGPFSLNADTITDATRSVFFISANDTLTVSGVSIHGNRVKTDSALSGQLAPGNAISIYGYDGGSVNGVSFVNNSMQGRFSGALVTIAGPINGLNIADNFAEYYGFYSVRSLFVESGKQIENVAISNNFFNALGNANGHINFIDSTAVHRGWLKISDNSLIGTFSGTSIIIGTPTGSADVPGFCELSALEIKNNILDGDSTILINRSVEAKVLNVSDNSFTSSGGTYSLYVIGANKALPFTMIMIKDNNCLGRARFIMAARQPWTSSVVFEGNVAGTRTTTAGITFNDGAASTVVGYIGLNHVNPTPKTGIYGTAPSGLYQLP